jgi:hypothetical protein
MIKLTINLAEPLAKAVGQPKIDLVLDCETATLADVLLALSERPGFREAYESGADGEGVQYVLRLNQRTLPVSAASITPCSDGDTLYIIPSTAGVAA